MIYLWDLRNNALIKSFICSSWKRREHISFYFLAARWVWVPPQGEQGRGGGLPLFGHHRRTSEVAKASLPRAGLRASRPAPVPTALQSSSDPVHPGRVQPPGKCREVREEHHTPTSLSACCRRLGTTAWGPGARGTLPLVRHRCWRWLPVAHRGVTPSPRKGSLVATRRDRPVASTNRALTSAGTPQPLAKREWPKATNLRNCLRVGVRASLTSGRPARPR